jgi:hypothetical protein
MQSNLSSFFGLYEKLVPYTQQFVFQFTILHVISLLLIYEFQIFVR